MTIPFINISDTECWMAYVMPFSESDRSNYDLVDSFQKQCIENNVFGMGWDIQCFDYGTPISKENVSIHAKEYQKKNSSGISEDALKCYLQIKKNDYVIMRLKDSHYYVGKVSSESAFYMYRAGDPFWSYFSWGCEVERWIEFPTDGDVPSEIVGRFSQRIHPTIQKIAPYRQRLLVIAMYENSISEETRCFSIPKLKISRENFTASLNYMELEDLVALFISEKHGNDGYVLLPSSCKISQPDYEFRFVSGNRKPITCQVKNKEAIPIEHYYHETAYERIYLFSGKWGDHDADALRIQCNKHPYIYVIKPSELFETLKRNTVFKNNYYDYQSTRVLPSQLNLQGYKLCKRSNDKCKKPNGDREYCMCNNCACFEKGDTLFYSSEFGALILSRHILDDDNNKELLIANRILQDINRDLESLSR